MNQTDSYQILYVLLQKKTIFSVSFGSQLQRMPDYKTELQLERDEGCLSVWQINNTMRQVCDASILWAVCLPFPGMAPDWTVAPVTGWTWCYDMSHYSQDQIRINAGQSKPPIDRHAALSPCWFSTNGTKQSMKRKHLQQSLLQSFKNFHFLFLVCECAWECVCVFIPPIKGLGGQEGEI